MEIKREMAKELKTLAKDYPTVTVMGPRQSGKTTLVQAIFLKKPYVNLEDPTIREQAVLDPYSFFDQYPNGAILDEIQRAPQLLSYIQVIVDKVKKKGMFILTGSAQFEPHTSVSQSLAGRTALLILLPCSLRELKKINVQLSTDELILHGGFPRIYHDRLDPTKAYRNYLQTYIERDLRKLIHVKDLMQFQRFMKLCAGRIGQVLNEHNLSNELGISSQTVKHWLSVLEASYIIFRLPPYFENFGKRIIKSSKMYFNDVGLATYLLGITTKEQVTRDPLRGNLFENMVILELIKTQFNRGLDHNLYYYRDKYQHEIDVIFKSGHNLIPIEIKSAKTFHRDFLKSLDYFQGLVNERCKQRYLIYSGENRTLKQTKLLNYQNASEIFSN